MFLFSILSSSPSCFTSFLLFFFLLFYMLGWAEVRGQDSRVLFLGLFHKLDEKIYAIVR